MKRFTFFKILFLLPFWLLFKLGHAFSCYEPQTINQKPIKFDKQRIALTRKYQFTHYGIDSIEIEPKIIVIHWTCLPNLAASFNAFNRQILPLERRDKLSGELNVSSHFLVDKDGSIYQLMPIIWMARHVIGLNHYAIGIENVGGVDGVDNLTKAQEKANAFLVCYLKKKYPMISYVIGHNEYLNYKNTPLWLEKDSAYQTDKTDPGPNFLNKVNQLIMASSTKIMA